MKLYNLGMVIGRFQMFHLGHESIVRHALEICDRVVVYVGSSQAANTEENPFSYNIRKKMIEDVFSVEVASKQLLIRPLPDIGCGNNDIWGRYLLGMFESEFHKQPNLYITGCEKERGSWFTDELAPNMDELRLTRGNIKTSGTICRQLMLDDKYEEWCKFIPYELYGSYQLLKEILVSVYNNGYAEENDI